MKSPILKLRQSTPSDGTRVIDIWCAAVDATHHFLEPADRLAIEQEVRGSLPWLPLWVAVDTSDRAVGFMALSEGALDALFIAPEWRGRGVGRHLVEHALAINPVLTTDVNEQNEQALGFYRQLGFVAFGRSPIDGQGRPYPLVHLRAARPL